LNVRLIYNYFLALITIEAQTSTTSNYAGALNMNSQTYTRYGSSGSFYYQAIEVRVPTTETYTFRSSSTIADTIGYIYQGNFYPSYPQYNIVAQDDDTAGGGQFLITATLRSDMTYILVFTSFSPVNTGTFDVTASGPGYVSLNPIYINTA